MIIAPLNGADSTLICKSGQTCYRQDISFCITAAWQIGWLATARNLKTMLRELAAAVLSYSHVVCRYTLSIPPGQPVTNTYHGGVHRRNRAMNCKAWSIAGLARGCAAAQ